MKRFSILVMIIFFALPMYAQEDHGLYIAMAQSLFERGEYSKAQQALNVYITLTDNKQIEFATKIKQCLKYEESAEKAKNNNEYKLSVYYYKMILKINPTDINTQKKIEEIRNIQNISDNTSSKNISNKNKKFINDIRDISWIIGGSSGNVCGDVFGLYTMLKLGDPSGIAIEIGYSPGIMSLNSWSIGLKGYWKSLYGSALFGTTIPIYGPELEATVTDNGEIISAGSRNYGKYGFSFIIGYDKVFHKGFHLTFGAGIMVPITSTEDSRVLPAWNIGLGYDLFSRTKRNK